MADNKPLIRSLAGDALRWGGVTYSKYLLYIVYFPNRFVADHMEQCNYADMYNLLNMNKLSPAIEKLIPGSITIQGESTEACFEYWKIRANIFVLPGINCNAIPNCECTIKIKHL
jgi:hypothetical protein